MFQVYDNFTLKVKRASKNIRTTIVMIGVTCLVLSALYALYWSLATNGDIVIEYTQQYYAPLVSLFFDDVNLLENYLTFSKCLFIGIIPCAIAHYIVQKIEETLIYIHQKKTKFLNERKMIKQAIEDEKEYTIIKSYSICLSFDFSQNKKLTNDFSQKFSEYFAKKLKKELNKISNDIQIMTSKAILVYSQNFDNYDEIYSTVSKEVDNAKKMLGEKITLVPTITVDAYDELFIPQEAINQHFDIINCNLKGKATTTSMFRKKYTHINKTKYAGVPIGLYTTFKNENYKEYDLNIIQKI